MKYQESNKIRLALLIMVVAASVAAHAHAGMYDRYFQETVDNRAFLCVLASVMSFRCLVQKNKYDGYSTDKTPYVSQSNESSTEMVLENAAALASCHVDVWHVYLADCITTVLVWIYCPPNRLGSFYMVLLQEQIQNEVYDKS